MEVYKKQTQKIVKSFLGHQTTFPECIPALDAALVRFIKRRGSGEFLAIQAVLLANNETVMQEMEKREKERKAQAKFQAKKRT